MAKGTDSINEANRSDCWFNVTDQFRIGCFKRESEVSKVS